MIRRRGRLIFVGGWVIAFCGRGSGRMSYDPRWRWLRPVSTRFKIVRNECSMCLRPVKKCVCPDYNFPNAQ